MRGFGSGERVVFLPYTEETYERRSGGCGSAACSRTHHPRRNSHRWCSSSGLAPWRDNASCSAFGPLDGVDTAIYGDTAAAPVGAPLTGSLAFVLSPAPVTDAWFQVRFRWGSPGLVGRWSGPAEAGSLACDRSAPWGDDAPTSAL